MGRRVSSTDWNPCFACKRLNGFDAWHMVSLTWQQRKSLSTISVVLILIDIDTYILFNLQEHRETSVMKCYLTDMRLKWFFFSYPMETTIRISSTITKCASYRVPQSVETLKLNRVCYHLQKVVQLCNVQYLANNQCVHSLNNKSAQEWLLSICGPMPLPSQQQQKKHKGKT